MNIRELAKINLGIFTQPLNLTLPAQTQSHTIIQRESLRAPPTPPPPPTHTHSNFEFKFTFATSLSPMCFY